MTIAYDKYYQTENLFGEPYPELIAFFSNHSKRGKLLDLGCGQGRDAIPLARLGYEVTGIDHSKVGIEQMNQRAQLENLNLTGTVADIYQYNHFSEFDFILLDSMFHFTKSDKEKETAFVKRIIDGCKIETIVAFCIQNTGKKVSILNEAIDFQGRLERIYETDLQYVFKDDETGHASITNYSIVIIEK
ncbi:methyltransferase domain-containing protein [Fulvivirgaceae bacterium BMA10]|uniref:Methyltransferase domain-containing protein n=1 Tax=Splendidivirga corallicola TaxID=3051826 RepID=A0ABT8KMG2_9BACT|nr:methyltransferase domain-containing protein [Fulvivirgaceae bacterium BMA10]